MINRDIIIARIESLAGSEKVTKKELGLLSREMLSYLVVDDTNDIDMLNRLLAVLSPVNKRVAVEFFKHFVPFQFDKDQGVFSTKLKGPKKLAKYLDKVTVFLEGEFNNIWSWQAEHLKVEKKTPDYAKNITKNVNKALNDDEAGLEQADIVRAVLAGGLTIDAMVDMLSLIAAEGEAEEQKAA